MQGKVVLSREELVGATASLFLAAAQQGTAAGSSGFASKARLSVLFAQPTATQRC